MVEHPTKEGIFKANQSLLAEQISGFKPESDEHSIYDVKTFKIKLCPSVLRKMEVSPRDFSSPTRITSNGARGGGRGGVPENKALLSRGQY